MTNFDTENAYAAGTTVGNWLTGNHGSNEGIEAGKTVIDGEYYNLEATINGWYVDNIATDQQTCGNIEFKDKEGKWFGYPSGEATTLENLDEKEFTVQGLGTAGVVHSAPDADGQLVITLE